MYCQRYGEATYGSRDASYVQRSLPQNGIAQRRRDGKPTSESDGKSPRAQGEVTCVVYNQEYQNDGLGGCAEAKRGQRKQRAERKPGRPNELVS
jgi:hypothetical protein